MTRLTLTICLLAILASSGIAVADVYIRIDNTVIAWDSWRTLPSAAFWCDAAGNPCAAPGERRCEQPQYAAPCQPRFSGNVVLRRSDEGRNCDRNQDRDRGNQLGEIALGALLGAIFGQNGGACAPVYSPYQGGYRGDSAYAEAYRDRMIQLERQRRSELQDRAEQAGRAAADRAFGYGY